MPTFVIKNISAVNLTVLGSAVNANARLDLLTIATGSQIISSMRNGELFQLLQGKMIAVTDIWSFNNLGASQDDLDYFAYCGFMQGHLDSDQLRYPFKFSSDGYLAANITGISIPPLSVDIHGDSATPADRDSILAMGTETGSTSGTVHVLKIGADGYAQVSDLKADGYLNTIVTNTGLGMMQGFTVDGYASTEMPVLSGGKYLSDPTSNPLDANNKGHLLLDILRNLSVTLGTKLAGEDLNLDVMNTLAGCTYVSITTNTTTVIKSGAGALLGILFTTPGSVDNTVIFYDNTAASGTILIPSIPTDIAFTPKLLPLGGIYFNTGLTAITATGTASTFVVFYR